MRIAFFSPLPPARSGIADYSAALLQSMQGRTEIEVFSAKPETFDPTRYDAILYQLGNNRDHIFVYEMAMEYPGTVVLHEANLHHLIADLTIRRNDWEAYLREVEFDGGAEALEHGRLVRALKVGPDYEGLPMIRRVLSASKAAIAHSRFVEAQMRDTGFGGPIAVIPHGAWKEEAVNRTAIRSKLGVEPGEPLIGIFGHLKPYKRITESLRAFQRLIREWPRAKMILVGEPHPEMQLESTIALLGLSANIRIIGHAPIDEFTGLLASCDIVLNLRFPTVGETSGTLLRAMGFGRPVLVSDIGAFSEFSDEICLKVPIGRDEERLIFEYLKLLMTRPDLASAMGERARSWVMNECSWDKVGEQYVRFLEGQKAHSEATREIVRWTNAQPGSYVDGHLTRLARTIEVTPPGTAEDRILEMGAYLQITPALKYLLGYGEVYGCYYGEAGTVEHKSAVSSDGRTFECELDLFDAERDRFPYPDEWFSTVLCCELLEHLPNDPMHMMSEINRILKPGGHLVLTTPNASGLRAIYAIFTGYHPGFFPAYLKPSALERGDSRHNREYAAREAHLLLHHSGFEVTLLETGPFKAGSRAEFVPIERLLAENDIDTALRGEGIYAVGRKTGPVRERYPDWLYSA